MKIISLANLAAIVSVFVATLIISVVGSIGQQFQPLWSLLLAVVAALVAMPITLIWATPMHLLIRKFKGESVLWYLLIAVIPSILFIYILKPFGEDSAKDLATQAFFCSVIGYIAAMSFWYFSVYKQREISR